MLELLWKRGKSLFLSVPVTQFSCLSWWEGERAAEAAGLSQPAW